MTDIESLNDALGQSISQERFRTFLLGSFSAIALVLAAVGIFWRGLIFGVAAHT